MTAPEVIDAALAVRRGQRRLEELPPELRILVQQATRQMTDAQFARLAEQRQSRSRVANRAFATRGLHDGPATR